MAGRSVGGVLAAPAWQGVAEGLIESVNFKTVPSGIRRVNSKATSSDLSRSASTGTTSWPSAIS